MATETAQQPEKKKVAIEPHFTVDFKKNKADRFAPAAKAKLTEITFRSFRRNLQTGSINKIFDSLNGDLSTLRNDITKKELEEAEREAKFDEQVKNGKGGAAEFNQNLFVLKLNRMIARSTEPSKVIPILKNKNISLNDDKFSTLVQGETKPRPIMVAALLKEQLSTIGSKPKSYLEEQVKEKNEDEKTKEEIQEEAKKVRARNAKWKKAFKNIKVAEPQPVQQKTQKIKEAPVKEDTKNLTEGEIRRRRVIGEAGNEIEEIEKLELSLGENDQFNRALLNRKNRLIGMMSSLGNVEIKNKTPLEIERQNTEFQDLINEFLNVKEAPTKEEHDIKQKEYEDFYNDPFVQEQLNRQQLEGILYDYNQPEFLEKIMQNEREADRKHVQESIDKQEDTIKEINEEIISTKNRREKEAEENRISEELNNGAKVQAEMLLQNNLAAVATDEVINKYREKFNEELEYRKMLKRGAIAQAEILVSQNLAIQAIDEITNEYRKVYKEEKYRNELLSASKSEAEAYMIQNLASNAVDEVVDSYKQKYLNEIEEKSKLKKGAELQAELLVQKDLVNKAVDEVNEEIVRYYKTEKFRDEIKDSVRIQAETLLIQNLAIQAIEEVTNSIKNKYEKELEEKRNIINDARIQANSLAMSNLAAQAVEEVTEKYEKDSGLYHKRKVKEALEKGEKAVRDNNIRESANFEAKRIQRVIEKNAIKEDAKKTANNLFIKDLKCDAKALAKKMFNKELIKAGEEQANNLYREEIKNEAREEARIINNNRLRELGLETAKSIIANSYDDYSITDIDNRYLRVYSVPKAILVDSNKYRNLEKKSRNKYSNKKDLYMDNMIESLMGQLEELGLGDDSLDGKIKLAA